MADNKSKNLLRALCRAGLSKGSIHQGKAYKEYGTVLEGTLKPQKEYLVMFQDLAYVVYDVKMKLPQGDTIYFYEI